MLWATILRGVRVAVDCALRPWLDALSAILRMCVQLLFLATISRLISRGNILVKVLNAGLPVPPAVPMVLAIAASLIISFKELLVFTLRISYQSWC